MAVLSEYLKYMVVGEGLRQSVVYRVKRKGLGMHPCGTPVLMMGGGDMDVPALTDCGLFLEFLDHRVGLDGVECRTEVSEE